MPRIARYFLAFALALIAVTSTAAERVTYFVPDAQGSPVAAMDAQGNLLWRESYAPYGQRQTRPAENNARPAYTGKPEDAETGLVYMGARAYDPETARFTGIDPQGFSDAVPQSFGRYVYANNSPYKYADPNGESPVDVVFLAYDAGAFALALQSGNPAAIGAAAENFAISLGGVASPIPGTGQYIKGLRASSKISSDSARKLLEKNGFSEARARDFIDSFGGDITARIVRKGERFKRYTDAGDSKGSFLTKSEFDSPQDAVAGLHLGPYGNSAGLVQDVTASKSSIVLEGQVKNGGQGVSQSLVTDRGAFTFGAGKKYGK